MQNKYSPKSKQKEFMLRGLRPKAPNCFGLNPFCQLVIGYHWLAFLKQIHKNRKIDFAYISEHCASFEIEKNWPDTANF